MPLVTGSEASSLAPSKNAMVPVGTALTEASGAIVAVKVSCWPYAAELAFDLTAIVLPVLTVVAITDLVPWEDAKLMSPP